MAALYGWKIDYLINRYSIRKIGRLHDAAFKMQAEIHGAEIKEEWTEEEREAARKALYSQKELEELERAKK